MTKRTVITEVSSRTSELRRLLASPELEFFVEAHNGISAAIARDAGFHAIWASGFTISASLGVRDSNEASWTQCVEVVEFMADAVDLPILMDGDTGFGNFNNVRRLVKKLEQRGIAGVCIEDKVFPKTNSLIDGARHELARIDEFCGRIKAAKDTQRDDQFVVVARAEALVAGLGLREAVRRADAYSEAGADAILIHSVRSDAHEVLEFKRIFRDGVPVIIVPTKYPMTPTQVFRAHKFAAVIWANHLLRASVTAMQAAAARLFADQSISTLERDVSPVAEIFRLQNLDELQAAELRYLPR